MKERLDVILVNQGYAESREKAKAGIMAGDTSGAFNPDSSATRAQVAVVMVQMARVMGK